MPTTTELHDLIGGLQRCVVALAARYGESAAMRRVENDAECLLTDLDRLEIDADELESGRKRANSPQEKVIIADTAYDPTFWRGADDEGLGGTR
ncbi:hypothetical protein JYB55_05885 [Mycolicibacterium septicum]|nr:hypothetical protein [Mycolicibacterium septicum]